MILIRSLHNLHRVAPGCVLTIGNFDGVHLGHKKILEQVKGKAAELGVPSAVMIFEPQPQEFFAGRQAPARLMRFRDKFNGFRRLGIDRVICLQFNQRLQAYDSDRFVEEVLVQALGVRHLVIGDDFRFGRDRGGDFERLKAHGARLGFTVEATGTCEWQGERISSTRIREALERGDFEAAAAMLGHPYELAGRVVYGDQLGRTIGVPTANIALHRLRSPLKGVYAVRMAGLGDQAYPGVANIGHRPTVNGNGERLEVHLLDFEGDIYGAHVAVEFVAKLRDEQKFDGLPALKQAITQDIARARDIFSTTN